MWVTVWVKVLTHTVTHNKSRQKVRKTPDFRKKSGVFGAGGVIRTHDLLITNQLLYLLSYTSKYTTFRREVYFNTRKAFRQYKPELFLFLQKYTNSIQDFFLAKKSTAFSNFTYYSTFFPSMFF